jgi:hypothetical protein
MNDEPSIRFSTDPAPSAPSSSASPAAGSDADERVLRAAKLVAALFGLLLVVVLPLGALVSDHGVLSPTSKPTYKQVPPRVTQPSMQVSGTDSGDTSPLMKNQATPPIRTVPPQNIPPQPPARPTNGGIKMAPSAADTREMSTLVLGVAQSVRDYATNCRRNGGTVRSGAGGERLCTVSNFTLPWPAVSVCGASPSDTKWTVFRGDTDAWDITITCADRPECDGPSNALCTKNGCTFSETCLPK